MGCDIHSHVETKQTDGRWLWFDSEDEAPFECWWRPGTKTIEPFSHRNYGVFAFLADVRNYSDVNPIVPPRGVPEDASYGFLHQCQRWDGDAHSPSWVTLRELAEFDYDAIVEDRRVTLNGYSGCTCDPGEGRTLKWRDFLGSDFMRDLEALKGLGELDEVRVVFFFDN